MVGRARSSRPRRSRATRTRAAHQGSLEALAARLRQLRHERGLSQKSAATLIGVGPPVIRRMEAAVGNPSLAVLLSVARAFDIPIGYLFGKRGKRE
jgi:transcriptional regulator with XRE-family HTH domain